MSEAAVDLLASAPAAAPAAAAPSPAPAPAAASPSLPVANAPAPAANDWKWDAYAKDEDLGWLQTKGYKGPEDLIKAARNSEKMIGLDKVPLPKDDNDAEGWGRVYDKLGRPKVATEYKLALPENADTNYVSAMSKAMHEAGLSQRQAAALSKINLDYQTQAAQAQETAQVAKDQQEIAALKTEWGAAWDVQLEHARRGAREFGIDDAARGKLYQALGQAAAVKLLNRIGTALTEDKTVTGAEGSGYGAKTPQQAKYEIGQLNMDKGFLEAYQNRNHVGHQAAVEKMTRLQKFAAPE